LAYLLDTSAAILLRDDDESARASLATLPVLPMLSAVTKVELEGGVYARLEMREQRRQRLDELLATLEVLDFNSAMADIYGRIVSSHGFSRRKIIDRMIASTALACEAVLITANPGDFTDIAGLELEAWPIA
jgi:tRNA(fMet)-specific endonuclease VapC